MKIFIKILTLHGISNYVLPSAYIISFLININYINIYECILFNIDGLFCI